MVIIRCAFTAPMRQTTSEKFYSLLEDKSRNPLKYVQDFTSCKVTQESRNADGQLTNLTRLLRVQGFEEEIEEFVVFHPPMMVCAVPFLSFPYMVAISLSTLSRPPLPCLKNFYLLVSKHR